MTQRGAADFEALVRSKSRELYRYFRLSGADAHEAEDCVQETFLRIYAGWSRYAARGADGLAPLLYRAARSVWVDALRRRRRRPAPSTEEALDGTQARSSRPPEALAEDLELWAAVGGLPEKLRSVVILVVYQGLAYREAAEALGVPVGTAKSRMHLAVRALRNSSYGRASRLRER